MKNLFKRIIYLVVVLMFVEGAYANSKDIIRSLILPGWGELSINEKSRSKIFLYSDIAIIGTYLLGKRFNESYVDQYTGYAELYASTDMDDRGYAFVVDISNYNSMSEHNQDMENQRRFNDVYSDDYNWEWDSVNHRNKFNNMRQGSIIANKFAEFAIAGLIINRIASAVDVLYLKNRRSNVSLNAYIAPEKYDGISLNISFSSK